MFAVLTAAFLSAYFPTSSDLVSDNPIMPMYVQRGDLSGIHTIGVMSALGLSFDWDDKKLHPGDAPDIGEWKIDAFVADAVRARLSKRFAFKTVVFDPKDVTELPNDPRWRDALQAKYLAALPNPGVDAYLLVKPATPIIDRPQGNGLGAYPGSPPWMFAYYRIDLVDAHTGKTIEQGLSRIPTDEVETGPLQLVKGPPYVEGHSRNNDTVDESPTPAQWTALGADMKDLLDRSLTQTLEVLQLTDTR